jgi:hypothetical protein
MKNQFAQAILLKRARSERLLREAYVNHHGMDCIIFRVDREVPHRDIYGDIVNNKLKYLPEKEIKVVISSWEYVVMQDAFSVTQGRTVNKTDLKDEKYEGYIKFEEEVMKGDLLKVPYNIIDVTKPEPDEVMYMTFKIVDIHQDVHIVPLGKKLTLEAFF